MPYFHSFVMEGGDPIISFFIHHCNNKEQICFRFAAENVAAGILRLIYLTQISVNFQNRLWNRWLNVL